MPKASDVEVDTGQPAFSCRSVFSLGILARFDVIDSEWELILTGQLQLIALCVIERLHMEVTMNYISRTIAT